MLRNFVTLSVFSVFSIISFSALSAIDANVAIDFKSWKKQLENELTQSGISQTFASGFLARYEEDDILNVAIPSGGGFSFQRAVSQKTLSEAKKLLQTRGDFLRDLEKQFGVPSRQLAAIWALEIVGSERDSKNSLFSVLVSRAYRDGNARRELIAALRLAEQGKLDINQVAAKTDGTIGKFGFTPTAMERFGVDLNRDGRLDLSGDSAELLASYAMSLKGLGWQSDQVWGRQVRLPAGLDARYFSDKRQLSLAQWQQLGVRKADGSDLPAVKMMASLVKPSNFDGYAFLAYNNYYSLYRWKRSHEFALAASLVADLLEEKADITVFPFASN